MEKIIPIFYTNYGKYISRFRAIPFNIDFLIPAQRRLLLSLFEEAKGPKTIKSAKIVGHAIGNYHPHGDLSCYGTLVNLSKQGFLETQGNFGTPGLDDSSESAMRYTECCLKSWLKDFCFKYIEYVPWENFEYENEPTFLPCILPIGLIGTGGLYSGIAFHKCVSPRYKMSDLAKRLKWLIIEEGEEPIIYPTFELDGCTVHKNDTQAKSILNDGIGTLELIPKATIIGKSLHILGRVPQTNFNRLRKDPRIKIDDRSGETLDVEIKPFRKVDDLKTFYSEIFKSYLIKSINFNICVCEQDGKVKIVGVDEILINCYSKYVEAAKYKLINDCNEEIKRKFENEVILLIREVLKNNPTIKSVDDIVKIFTANQKTKYEVFDYENDKWITTTKEIKEEDIRNICAKRSIKALIENQINITNNDLKINSLKNNIINNVNDCFKIVCDIAAKI